MGKGGGRLATGSHKQPQQLKCCPFAFQDFPSQSHVSRQDRDFCSLNFEREFFYILGFGMGQRYFLSSLMFRDGTSRRD